MQWGLDFIGYIHRPSSTQHRWILTATNYFTKWIESIPIRQATDTVIIQFLEINILSRFGCLVKIITDNSKTFKSKRMKKFCSDYNITLGHSTTYYPQDNGLAKSSNKILTRIIKKLLQENKKSWHKILSMHYGMIGSLPNSIFLDHLFRLYGTE
jgi:transposase InsO family protein